MLYSVMNCVCFSVLISAPALLPPLSLMLESVLHAEQHLMDRTKAKLLSALILALQIQGLNGQFVCVLLIFESCLRLVLWQSHDALKFLMSSISNQSVQGSVHVCMYCTFISVLLKSLVLCFRRRDYPATPAAVVRV